MPFQKLFEPAVKPRENIRLTALDKYYRVSYIEPIFGILYNLGAVSSGNTSSLTEMKKLDLNSLEVGQWRILILDDFELIVKQPRASERGTTKTESTRITPYTLALDPDLKSTEFYTFEDKTRIYIQAENITEYTVIARVFFYGWKFLVEEIKQPAKWTDIPVAVVTRATE